MTIQQYIDTVNKEGITKKGLPNDLQEFWDFAVEITEGHTSTYAYENNDTIKEAMDAYMELFEKFTKPEKVSKPKHSPKEKKPKKVIKKPSEPKAKPIIKSSVNPKADKVEVISDELKFIRRYVNMHDKPKTRNQIRLFVNAIQRSIRERRIRKTSPYAKEIMLIQDELIKLHSAFKNDDQIITIDISEKTRTKFFKVIGKEVELLSVKLIKSYIGLQGRIVENIKASRLLKRIESAISKKRITKRDAYWSEIEQIISNLQSFVKKNPNHGVLQIEERTLNGLQGIVDCGCYSSEMINGLPDRLDVDRITEEYYSSTNNSSDRFIMNSMDFSKVQFQNVGFKGKWFDFIGDPEVGFRAMTYGQPKMGKSFLMIELGGYLAKNHGSVLYVAKEEGKSATLKEKLTQTASTHPRMVVSNFIPENIDQYDFVFLDSVTKLKLTPENLVALNKSYPKISFIEIHQVTKQGSARGQNDFSHDPDILIHVSSKGFAEQNGRYNQGGELYFFDNASTAA